MTRTSRSGKQSGGFDLRRSREGAIKPLPDAVQCRLRVVRHPKFVQEHAEDGHFAGLTGAFHHFWRPLREAIDERDQFVQRAINFIWSCSVPQSTAQETDLFNVLADRRLFAQQFGKFCSRRFPSGRDAPTGDDVADWSVIRS